MMKFIIETITGRKGIKKFDSLYEYIDFMTKNGNKIKSIVESDMPYNDKPVKLPKISTSKGWSQIDSSAFGDINSDGEKGDCLLPSGNQGVFKNNAQFEPSKSSEKEDSSETPKIENSPIKSNNDGEEKDLPKFKYEDKSDSKENKENSDKDKKEEVKESYSENLDEDFKSGLKKAGKFAKGAIVGAAMAGALAGNAHGMEDPYYDGATQPYEDSYEQVQNEEKPMIKSVRPDGTIIDQYGNEYTKEQFDALLNGEDPYYDGATQPFDESTDFDSEIKEALRIAGVELNEYYNQADDELDDGQDIDDEKVINSIKQMMKDKNISEEEAVQEYINFSGMDENIVQDIWNDYKSYSEQVNNEEDGQPDEKSGKKKLFEEDPLEEAPMSDEDFDSLEDGDKVNWDLSKYRGNYTVKKDDKGIHFMGDQNQGNQFNMERDKDYVKKYFSKGHKESPAEDSLEYAEDQVKAWENEVKMAEYDDYAYTNGRMREAKYNLSYWKNEVEKRKEKEPNLEESSNEQLEEEITPSRLWKYQEHPEMNFAILSADRSERTPEENKEKSEELKKDIKSMGYWYTELKGGYVEVGKNGKRVPIDGEDSFIVPNMTKEEAMELGKKYDQDTVMFKDAKAHTLQYIITNERAGNVGDADSSFETQAGKDNFSVSSGNNLDYYSRLPKSNKKYLKIGFNWKG